MSKLLVPSLSGIDALEKLSRQPATVVELLTVNGQERWLFLERAENQTFVGHAFDPKDGFDMMRTGPIASVAFDDTALVYYATPPHPFEMSVPAERVQFPSLPPLGAIEQRASCAELDVELARSEAVRWYARQQGAAPYTPGEVAATHAKNAAKYTAMTALVILMMAGGGGGCCGSGGDRPALLSGEDWRWAVTAADRRTIGLLQLKQTRHCEARAVAGADRSDLQILEQIEIGERDRAAGHFVDTAYATQTTSWLDQLNPVPLRSPADLAHVNSYGEGAGAVFDKAVWAPNLGSFKALQTVAPWQGTIVLTEKSLILQRQSAAGVATGQEIRIPYADIAAVETNSKMRTRWVAVTQRDGHVDSFWFVQRIVLDRERTEAVGALLRSKIPAPQTPPVPAVPDDRK
jgi:hypothetical protein